VTIESLSPSNSTKSTTNYMQFRKALTDELPIALALLKQAAQALKDKGVNQWGFWLDPPFERINWIKEGFENNEFYFVVNDDNVAIAMFRIMEVDEMYWGHQADLAYYIHSLVVTPSHTGLKLGERIIKEVESMATTNRIKLLRLDCNASNLALCGYYERLGFVKVGEKQMPYSLNNLYEKSLG
jgi:ribosomal protein S18 acetylase RimI-like enzyme